MLRMMRFILRSSSRSFLSVGDSAVAAASCAGLLPGAGEAAGVSPGVGEALAAGDLGCRLGVGELSGGAEVWLGACDPSARGGVWPGASAKASPATRIAIDAAARPRAHLVRGRRIAPVVAAEALEPAGVPVSSGLGVRREDVGPFLCKDRRQAKDLEPVRRFQNRRADSRAVSAFADSAPALVFTAWSMANRSHVA